MTRKTMSKLIDDFKYYSRADNFNGEGIAHCCKIIKKISKADLATARTLERCLLQNVLCLYMNGEENPHLAYLALDTSNLDLEV